ncbi:mitochondrial chaperone BCS1 [Sarocladium implicatum]|nr:mitochondrial chaperone BCS1 [Sarocladium implicatum]
MAPSSRPSRVRPSEVAADTKRNFIPLVKATYSEMFPPYSVLYVQPVHQLAVSRRTLSTRPPVFRVEVGDPVMQALYYSAMDTQTSEQAGGQRVRIPFICAANERRPGGDWETGCSGYEEKLCRRSNLSATLSSPWPNTASSNYPIPSEGGILSDSVVVCRGPHDRYEKLDRWYDLPVVSVPPTRWPKLKDHGSKYSFSEERAMIRDKIRGALRICLYNNYDRVVIGDFGLGNGHRNPPQELAEIWRDVFLFDPDLRGQFVYVIFAFEDPNQSTTRLILDEIAKKESKSSSRGKSRGSDSSSSSSKSHSNSPSDRAIFEYIFSEAEIERALREPDPRYKLDMITS